MVLPVLLMRQANGLALEGTLPFFTTFVERMVKGVGAGDVERTVVTVGAATFWSADGLVRVFAARGQRSHAPPRHSRHNKTQMNGRERITIGQMIISQNRHKARMHIGDRRWLTAVGPRCLVALKQSEGGCAAIIPSGAAAPPYH